MPAEILSDLSRATDSNSSPLSGAKWYFYATGTLSPLAVYTTADLDTPHANPVVADSGGQFASIYFDASLQYRGILKDAAGATLRDIDPINPAASLFFQTGDGAVARDIAAKARESVSIEDFYSGDFADAIEAASAVGATVHIYGASYEIDRIATVAADTDLVLHGTTISAAAGNTATHMLTFAGNGSITGTGTFDGDGMDAPTASWAGVGVPQGSCIYAAGASDVARSGSLRIAGRITFRNFPSGPIYGKWLDLFEADGIILDNCQTATVQWKASGSYVNIPGTTNSGTSTDPVGEIIVSHGIQVYNANTAIVRNCRIPAFSKGISISAREAYSTGNTFLFGTDRHAMEHLTNCERVVSLGNTYDGREDKGDGSKIVFSDSASSGGHTFTDCSFGLYMQDTDNLQVGPDTMTGIVKSAYGVANTSATGGKAITNSAIRIGSLVGAGAGSSTLYFSTDAGAIAAGYNVDVDVFGGVVSGFETLVNNNTVGLGGILDLSWTGTTIKGATTGMDLRIENCNIDLTFKNCTAPLINLGSTIGGAGGYAQVKVVAYDCTGTPPFVRVATGAGAYEGKFDRIDLGIKSSNCTSDQALSFALGAADSLKLLNLEIDCPDLDPDASGSSGQAITFDANSKTFKARMKITALGLGASTPMNVTLSNAGSVTGVYEKPIAGTLTGGALTAV